jgi:hypothetical protein
MTFRAFGPLIAGLAIFGFLALVLFARSLLVGEPGLDAPDIVVAIGASVIVLAGLAVWWVWRLPTSGPTPGWTAPTGSTGSVHMFQRFDVAAKRALTLAQDEAQRLDHHYIGTEHLLLGLVREGDGLAARVLENMHVELHQVRTAVEAIIGRGQRPIPAAVGLTPRAKRVIELTVTEARRLGDDHVGTEHLLLGLLREGEGIAAGVLESLGLTLNRVDAAVRAELGRQA